jgi:hypothetical protein
MEPLNENELDELLRKWEAPGAPPSLKRHVFPVRASWWAWLFRGTIRVPVPLVLAAAVLIALWVHYSRSSAPPRAAEPGTVSLADFKPVPQLEPVVVSGGQR